MLNLDYLAGFFDGEGCVHFYIGKSSRSSFGVRVRVSLTIAQKHDEILRKIRDFLGFGAIYRDSGYCRYVVNSSRNVLRFIELMADKVILKRDELFLAKEVIECFPKSGTPMTRERMLTILEKIKRYREIIGRKQAHHYNLDKAIDDIRKMIASNTVFKITLEHV
ncbi:MAG: LAGLIDADG family homing endonuclease [Candidatus Bathyarchaeia archaeon]